MAYGLKYRNNFEGINDLTNVKYNVLLEILQDGYVGAVTDIEEMDKNPLQFRLDNSGDAHFVPIKKTSVSINIVDTNSFYTRQNEIKVTGQLYGKGSDLYAVVETETSRRKRGF